MHSLVRMRDARVLNELSHRVIGAAIEVHRHLGPGLLESVYEHCLCYELSAMRLPYARQMAVPLVYKGWRLDWRYRLDLVVDEGLVIEVKTVDHLLPVHVAQVLTYLKLSGFPLALLINFNSPVLKNGIRRVVNGLADC